MTELKIAPIELMTGQPKVNNAARAAALQTGQPSFGQWLESSLSEVSRLSHASDTAQQKLITGESTDIHNTMIAMQKSGVAMDLMLEVRNKVIAAYEEIKRMQI
jgi:flagellar hook-basal body complex protein FliE